MQILAPTRILYTHRAVLTLICFGTGRQSGEGWWVVGRPES